MGSDAKVKWSGIAPRDEVRHLVNGFEGFFDSRHDKEDLRVKVKRSV